VAEKLLNVADVRTPFQQMGGEPIEFPPAVFEGYGRESGYSTYNYALFFCCILPPAFRFQV